MSPDRVQQPPRPSLLTWLLFGIVFVVVLAFMVILGLYRAHLQTPVPGTSIAPGESVSIEGIRFDHVSLTSVGEMPAGSGSPITPDEGSAWVALSLHMRFEVDGLGYSTPCAFELHTMDSVYVPSPDSTMAVNGSTSCYGGHLVGEKTIPAGTEFDLGVWWQVPGEVAAQPMTARVVLGIPLRAVEFRT
ncbi:hypothetical protein HMPREF1531_00646 [Propionibacterium sp. oral taxon 192 str. F0372]|uniref:hypothetical protein n=1 Tax=Propionibacterium sp. oral taxon 192 TaxID=671222 RepID=UPI0003541658|nr:hypothetical protein [Propionibacterium sp. oral taxon 192]EPH05998.1 hypothetical protein HMPREF1531_00646 [Propionibacterium sp. oral taxon 192 str. F0372]